MGKKLIVTAKLREYKFKAIADPYNPKEYQEQYDSCIMNIHKQMEDEGLYEMRDLFKYYDNIKGEPEQ